MLRRDRNYNSPETNEEKQNNKQNKNIQTNKQTGSRLAKTTSLNLLPWRILVHNLHIFIRGRRLERIAFINIVVTCTHFQAAYLT